MATSPQTPTAPKPSSGASAPTTKLAGGVVITPPTELPDEMFGLIWGPAGMGKTTLACTAPGRKLLVNFDPKGPDSIAFREDVQVADFSGSEPSIVESFKSTSNPLGLASSLDLFDTVVLDSLTLVQELTTRAGIEFSQKLSKSGGGSYVELPGLQASQARNNLLLELVRNLSSLCLKKKKNFIMVGHEGKRETDKEGNLQQILIHLGGSLPNNVSIRLSEIWAMYELNGQKTIAIRPCRFRTPIKSRMFNTSGNPEFKWNYDPDDADEEQSNMTIAGWQQQWVNNGKRKIALPK